MWNLNKHDVIQLIINTNKFERYLEIGTANLGCFNRTECKYKVGCDPRTSPENSEYRKLYSITSDEFFKMNAERYQIVFIDGLHHYEQLVMDILNSWNVLEPGGFIVSHDCMPMNESTAGRSPTSPQAAWNGDCYKAIIWFRDTFPSIPCFVISEDHGLGLIYKNKIENLPMDCSNILSYMDLSYTWLQENRDRLNLIDAEMVKKLITQDWSLFNNEGGW